MQTARNLILNPPELQIDDTVLFRIGHAMLVPKSPGVYVIHDLRGILYIGRSENLHRRFEQHLWRSDNPYLIKAMAKPVGDLCFSWCLSNFPEQVAVESGLIKAFRPPCNRQGVK